MIIKAVAVATLISMLNFTPTITTQEAIVTAYAPHDNVSGICNDGDPNSTATGTYPEIGTLAVDPNEIPYETNVYILGYGWGVAEDTGYLLRADEENVRVDVYKETHAEAMKFGRQELRIIIIGGRE